MLTTIVSSTQNILQPAHQGDVGYDLVASSSPVIVGEKLQEEAPYYKSIDYIEYEVDLQIAPPEGVFSLIYPRSSISKYNLALCNSVGVIDNGYRGKLKIRFNYLFQPRDLSSVPSSDPEYDDFAIEVNEKKIYQKGDKIAQLVFSVAIIPNLVVSELNETTRGQGGFGSTGS